MEQKVFFLESTGEIRVDPKTTPAFYRLYLQAILLELKARNVLTEEQLQLCLNRLQME